MLTSSPVEDRTLRSRFEVKYLVDPSLVPLLRKFILPFLRPDAFTKEPGASYDICSLYLDSPDLALCRQTLLGIKNRFKVRIRSYTDDPLVPVYLEIKRRVDRIILKKRAIVDRERVPAVLDGRLPPREAVGAGSWENVSEFHHLVAVHGLRPVARVRYRREAYQSASGEPLRITFDREVACAETPGWSVSHTDGEWSETPVEGAIFEVKFTHYYPSWVSDMVREFQLRQCSVPKYVLSMSRLRDIHHLPFRVGPPLKRVLPTTT